VVGTALAATVCAVVLLWPRPDTRQPPLTMARMNRYATMAALGLAEVPSEPVSIVRRSGVAVMARRVPTGAVPFYLIDDHP
jgi:hypothetical protein